MSGERYSQNSVINALPVLPLRDTVVFPGSSSSLYVARPKSIESLEYAAKKDCGLVLYTQCNAKTNDPDGSSLFEIGVIVCVLQLLRLSGDTLKILVEGQARVKRRKIYGDSFLMTDVVISHPPVAAPPKSFEPAKREIVSLFESLYMGGKENAGSEIAAALMTTPGPRAMAELLAMHLNFTVEQKQAILEANDGMIELDSIRRQMEVRIELRKTDSRIQGRVRSQMERGQKEYYLNEQLKAIRKELGDLSGSKSGGEELAEKLKNTDLPEEARQKASLEAAKLDKMPPMAAEATVIHTYLDTLLSLPWGKRSKVSHDLAQAEKLLDSNHYGLREVKDRILEYLAVYKRVDKLAGPILCLVGAPGVGKSALGRSVATSVGREFARIALGGMHDEAEIRGHRRTYIGSMPGKILQGLIKVKNKNPVMMLDEIDKLSADFRGDPASSLLEVLDPEQNNEFADHYLEVGFDLSEVMFIATANTLQIPAPLLDRMEKIHIPGYIEDEKLQIALRHLIPRQKKNHGLKNRELILKDDVIMEVIQRYTREAGVRELERLIARICRKSVRYLYQRDKSSIKLSVRRNAKSLSLKLEDLVELIGLPRYKHKEKRDEARIGQAMGMAWTEVGGDLLNIEATMMPGKGKVSYTGLLGKVMQESIEAAMALVRSRADNYRIAKQVFQENDFHVHVPEGAAPKDGPSAGGAISLALLSCILEAPVKVDLALTGEITLRGSVLPIGGLREKLIAAVRGGISKVIIPHENLNDLREIPDNIKSRLEIVPVHNVGEIFDIGLEMDKKEPDFFTENWIGSKLTRDEVGKADVIINH
ncbi:MAG: endopeptidase La [Gammaproteobacteria bacterium]|nr:endopeptidase La [Gammaproteobacteria bacterium]